MIGDNYYGALSPWKQRHAKSVIVAALTAFSPDVVAQRDSDNSPIEIQRRQARELEQQRARAAERPDVL